MPHQKRILHVAARRVSVTAALLCIGGCSGTAGDSPDTGELVVILASNVAPGASILASTSDPSTSSHDGGGAATVPPDSAALFRALGDSAARLDASFQRERAELNREALALRDADRTSADYHSRYQAFERRAAAAVARRAARDHAQGRAAELRKRYPALAAPTRGSDGAARPIRFEARDTVRLSLAPGDWWIALSTSPATSRRVTLRAGGTDTLRLR
jgi:hypothetical protein